MNIHQLATMQPTDAQAWLEHNKATFALIPRMPTIAMLIGAAGYNYSLEEAEDVTNELKKLIEAHEGHSDSDAFIKQQQLILSLHRDGDETIQSISFLPAIVYPGDARREMLSEDERSLQAYASQIRFKLLEAIEGMRA